MSKFEGPSSIAQKSEDPALVEVGGEVVKNLQESGDVSEEVAESAGESLLSLKEIQERYEQPYRDAQAKDFSSQRNKIQQKRQAILEKYSDRMKDGEIASMTSRYSVEIDAINRLKQQLESDAEHRVEARNLQTSIIKSRNLMERARLLLKGVDREKMSIQKIDAEYAEIQQRIEESTKALKEIEERSAKEKEEATRRVEQDFAQGEERETQKIDEERENLRKRVSEVNKNSKEAITVTAEQMEKGMLNITDLARETNALVVHGIPLEGWNVANTSMNNTEVAIGSLTTKDKIDTIYEKQPDISASIVHIDKGEVDHGVMYPFGLIVDGTLIASYNEDSSTITKGDTRYRKGTNSESTLQTNPAEEFKKNAQQRAGVYGWNESIVHKPNIKGIFIDGEKLKPVVNTEDGSLYDYYKDTVTEYYSPDQESVVMNKYDGKIKSVGRGTPKSGPYAGVPTIKIERMRSGVEKAIEYAEQNYPELPVYIRGADGVYDREGNKVDAVNIYS